MAKPLALKRNGAYSILGLPLHPVDVDKLQAFIGEVISKNQKALILNLNIHAVNLALKYEWLFRFFNEAQLVFCDGDGVRWGAKLLGCTPPPKITYDRWFWQLASFCEQRGFSFYLLGSQPGIAERAAGRLRARHPGLEIRGFHHGYFDFQGPENEAVLSEINRLKPHILVVGFGMPLQEKWLQAHWHRLNVHVFLTGGAVFDCISGMLSSPPGWIIRMQMEWFYRFLQQPRRRFLRYFWGNPYFFARIFLEKLNRWIHR